MQPVINPGQPLSFNVSEGEKKNIEIIRLQLIIELDAYAINEREELITETENHLLPKRIAEQLERIKYNTINDLDFSDAHYEQKCFYINENGHPAITTDINLFHSFIYAYSMLGDMHYGTRTAKNIIKVSIIDRMVKMVLQELDFKTEWKTSTTNNLYPFVNIESKKFFAFCVKNWINKQEKPKTPISYLFHKMWIKENDTENFKYQIDNITIREFAEFWNDHINHNYKIQFDGKSAKLKSPSDMPSKKIKQTFDKLITDFES